MASDPDSGDTIVWIVDNSCPRQHVPMTTRTQANSYPGKLVPKTTRTHDDSYPEQFRSEAYQEDFSATIVGDLRKGM